MSRSVRIGFWKTSYENVVAFVIIALLIAASGFGIWKAFTAKDEHRVTPVLVSYQHAGAFDYTVYASGGILYGLPAQTSEQASATYYKGLIDHITASFDYDLVPPWPEADTRETVTISALIADPGRWTKEVTLVPEQEIDGPVELSFDLNLQYLEGISNSIEQDIGVLTNTNDITLRADVHVVSSVDDKVFEDDFVQTTQLSVDPNTLEWKGGLSSNEFGSFDNRPYEHRGQFDYAIHLKENALFGATTFGPPGEQDTDEAVALAKGQPYFTNLVDSIEGSFSYDFNSSQPINRASAQVSVTATLQYPGFWSKSFILVPQTTKLSDFTVDYPIDFDRYLQLAADIRSETGMGAVSYQLDITANVDMVAETEHGTINESFSQNMQAQLSDTRITLDQSLGKSQRGSIRGETVVTYSPVLPLRVGSIVGPFIALAVAFYLIRRYKMAKMIVLVTPEEEALHAKKKRKDIVVDIEESPRPIAEDLVISLDSLDALIRVADSLLKPVLHQAEAEKHSYWVVDGFVLYNYVSQPILMTDESEAEEED